MKKTFIGFVLLLVILPVSACAQDYYVDATNGDDSKDGLSEATAWKTIYKVNDASFNPGDNILFKRGEIWRERLDVPSSGNSTDQITFTNYGSGADPIINGADLMTTWVEHVTASTYGDTTPPGTAATYAANYIYFHQISVGSNGVGASISLYIQNEPPGKPSTGNIKCALYTDVAGEPTALVTNGTTEEKAWADINHSEWTTFNFTTPPTITLGTYWIAVWSDQQYGRAKVSGGSSNWCYDSETYDGWPSADPSTQESYADMDAYLSLTPINIWKKTSVTTEPDVVFFDGTYGANEASGVNSLGTEKEWFWDSDVLYIYTTGGDPDTQWPSGIDVGQRDTAITTTNRDYITIENIDLRYANDELIWMQNSDYCIVDSCTITGASENGIYGWAVTNNIFRNLTMSYVAKIFGFEVTSDNNIFEYSDFSNCGGMALYNCDSNIIRYNNFHDSGTTAVSMVELHPNSDYNEVYYNIFDTVQEGVDLFSSYNKVYNNIFYMCTWPGLCPDGGEFSSTVAYNVIKNNIFYTATAIHGDTCEASNTIENNCYYYPGGITIYWDDVPGENWGEETFAQWKARGKYDQNSFEADPLFVNASNNDFHLQASSLCINNGTDVGLTQDFEGNPVPQGSAPDIGAYEYAGGTPGDIDNDGDVDIQDLTIVAIHLGQTQLHQDWNATADVVQNYEIDVYDVVFVASRFT